MTEDNNIPGIQQFITYLHGYLKRSRLGRNSREGIREFARTSQIIYNLETWKKLKELAIRHDTNPNHLIWSFIELYIDHHQDASPNVIQMAKDQNQPTIFSTPTEMLQYMRKQDFELSKGLEHNFTWFLIIARARAAQEKDMSNLEYLRRKYYAR